MKFDKLLLLGIRLIGGAGVNVLWFTSSRVCYDINSMEIATHFMDDGKFKTARKLKAN